jgi:hypothetical protein
VLVGGFAQVALFRNRRKVTLLPDGMSLTVVVTVA